MLKRLSQGILPDEVVLKIFKHLVAHRLPRAYLVEKNAIRPRGMHCNILEAYTGILILAQRLSAVNRAFLEQVVLEESNVSLDIGFKEQADGSTLACLPSFVATLPHQIWHLDTTLSYCMKESQMDYPHMFLRWTRGMASLRTLFPNLHSSRLILELCPDQSSTNFLAKQCIIGYTSRTTFEAVLEGLFEAFRDSGPGKSKTVQIQHQQRFESLEGNHIIVNAELSSVRILSQAFILRKVDRAGSTSTALRPGLDSQHGDLPRTS